MSVKKLVRVVGRGENNKGGTHRNMSKKKAQMVVKSEEVFEYLSKKSKEIKEREQSLKGSVIGTHVGTEGLLHVPEGLGNHLEGGKGRRELLRSSGNRIRYKAMVGLKIKNL